jgi:hypothetical protein
VPSDVFMPSLQSWDGALHCGVSGVRLALGGTSDRPVCVPIEAQVVFAIDTDLSVELVRL